MVPKNESANGEQTIMLPCKPQPSGLTLPEFGNHTPLQHRSYNILQLKDANRVCNLATLQVLLW